MQRATLALLFALSFVSAAPATQAEAPGGFRQQVSGQQVSGQQSGSPPRPFVIPERPTFGVNQAVPWARESRQLVSVSSPKVQAFSPSVAQRFAARDSGGPVPSLNPSSAQGAVSMQLPSGTPTGSQRSAGPLSLGQSLPVVQSPQQLAPSPISPAQSFPRASMPASQASVVQSQQSPKQLAPSPISPAQSSPRSGMPAPVSQAPVAQSQPVSQAAATNADIAKGDMVAAIAYYKRQIEDNGKVIAQGSDKVDYISQSSKYTIIHPIALLKDPAVRAALAKTLPRGVRTYGNQFTHDDLIQHKATQAYFKVGIIFAERKE